MRLRNCSPHKTEDKEKQPVYVSFLEGNCLQWIIGHLGGNHKGQVLPKMPMGVLI